jgi:hypothetical protein
LPAGIFQTGAGAATKSSLIWSCIEIELSPPCCAALSLSSSPWSRLAATTLLLLLLLLLVTCSQLHNDTPFCQPATPSRAAL